MISESFLYHQKGQIFYDLSLFAIIKKSRALNRYHEEKD